MSDRYPSIEDEQIDQAFIDEFIDATFEFGRDYGPLGEFEYPKDLQKAANAKWRIHLSGYQKLGNFVRVAPKYDPLTTELDNGHATFFTQCSLLHSKEGYFRGAAVGECNTREKPSTAKVCPKCNKAAIAKSSYEGEGYYCNGKKGGCYAKFGLNDKAITEQSGTELPGWEMRNKAVKMAMIRSYESAVGFLTGTGDYFSGEAGIRLKAKALGLKAPQQTPRKEVAKPSPKAPSESPKASTPTPKPDTPKEETKPTASKADARAEVEKVAKEVLESKLGQASKEEVSAHIKKALADCEAIFKVNHPKIAPPVIKIAYVSGELYKKILGDKAVEAAGKDEWFAAISADYQASPAKVKDRITGIYQEYVSMLLGDQSEFGKGI